ncbi:MAG: hypothetical protein FJ214_12510 [Ignavibacteria bacterium]|nr:hypothetical protein [Ignavibacteria bacterium]
MKSKSKRKKIFDVINVNIPDEVIWEEYWKDKSPVEKLEAAEKLRDLFYSKKKGKNASQRLQRIFRIAERT